MTDSTDNARGPERFADTARNLILYRTLTDLDRIINGHDPEVDTSINNLVWDRLDKMAQEIEARAYLTPDPLGARAWQPIGTAPKDELIDIWLSDGVRWCDCYHDRICDEWRTSRPSGRLLSIKAKHVTHWMPRPTPPALAAFDKGGKDE